MDSLKQPNDGIGILFCDFKIKIKIKQTNKPMVILIDSCFEIFVMKKFNKTRIQTYTHTHNYMSKVIDKIDSSVIFFNSEKNVVTDATPL